MSYTTFQIAVEGDGAELVAALCAVNGYQAIILDENEQEIPNPETPQQFANRMVREKFLAPTIRAHRQRLAAAAPLPDMKAVDE